MKYILILFLFTLLFTGCEELIPETYKQDSWISFADVSDSFHDKYGSPEEVDEYESTNYHSIDWWWWSKGFMVNFLLSTYNDVYGWTVDHTYSFDPIY